MTDDIKTYAYQNQPRPLVSLMPAGDPYHADRKALPFTTGKGGATIASSDFPWRIPATCRSDCSRLADRPGGAGRRPGRLPEVPAAHGAGQGHLRRRRDHRRRQQVGGLCHRGAVRAGALRHNAGSRRCVVGIWRFVRGPALCAELRSGGSLHGSARCGGRCGRMARRPAAWSATISGRSWASGSIPCIST